MTFPPRNTSRAPMEEDVAHRLAVLGRAPELVGVDPWLNTPDGEPLRLAALRDRVVLLEFWTFACVNCQHTLQFLRRMNVGMARLPRASEAPWMPVDVNKLVSGHATMRVRVA